ncbi:MAG: hypothetical protein ACLGG5_03760, partial [Thermoleophilia bacterium]
DHRLAVALLAGAVSHTPEGEEVLRGARMRMARKPSAIARELLRNFPKGGKRRNKRGKKRPKRDGAPANGEATGTNEAAAEAADGRGDGRAQMETEARPSDNDQKGKRNADGPQDDDAAKKAAKPKRRRKRAKKAAKDSEAQLDLAGSEADTIASGKGDDEVAVVVDPVGDA